MKPCSRPRRTPGRATWYCWRRPAPASTGTGVLRSAAPLSRWRSRGWQPRGAMDRSESGVDRGLLLTAVTLILVGVFCVFNASFARAAESASTGHNPYYFLVRQAMWAALSLGALWASMRYPYWRLRGIW